MDCNKLKIAINNSLPGNFAGIKKDFSAHLAVCEDCRFLLSAVERSFSYMQEQKLATLSDEATTELLTKLHSSKSIKPQTPALTQLVSFMNKYAAVFVVAIGLAVGMFTGNALNSTEQEIIDPWAQEFSELTENNIYSSELFE